MSEFADFLPDFLAEGYENLDRVDGELLALEEDPGSIEILSSIFRTIHSIKGACGFIGFSNLGGVTHVGENLLSALREGEVELTGEITTALLKLTDAVREMLVFIEAHGHESDCDYTSLIRLLTSFLEPAASSEPAPTAESSPEEAKELEVEEAAVSVASLPAEVEEESAGGDENREGSPGAHFPKSGLSSSTIRIQVDQLDSLMNLAGELVLARNQILQTAADSSDSAISETAQCLNLVTSELQEGIMKIRMQPIGTLLNKLPRVVRDLTQSLDKQVRLLIEGKETELDKTILEAVKDPITHLIRNAIDHGIETPAERASCGKPEEGILCVRAFHEGGQVIIEIVDDGGGISPERLQEKALANGLISRDQVGSMSDRQILNLIFHPGLSTAAKVTDVSGRGVGMDVVKTNIEGIGGTIEVLSDVGKGTTIRIRIPLTLAIIPALIVTAAGDRYAIPQVSLVELVRLSPEEAAHQIESLHGSPVYRLRGDLLPLVFLDEELAVSLDRAESLRNIIVVKADERQFGLVVDKVIDTEEIVVKPLDKQIKSVPIYAGTTILGDGKVALIIDVMGLAERASVITEERHSSSLDVEDLARAKNSERETYLISHVANGHRIAVPLNDVSRLEEFPAEAIEHMRGMEVVQYRGEIMPLLRISKILGLEEEPMEVLPVIVYVREGNSVGLVVSEITDITEIHEPVTRTFAEGELPRTIVINDRVTELLNIQSLVEKTIGSAPSLGTGAATKAQAEATEGRTKQFCTFYVDDLFFGVDVMFVQEVLRYQEMTRVPLTSDAVHGLINLRGQTVTALDIRQRLRIGTRSVADDGELPMKVVLRSADGVVSVLVDRIGDVLTVDESQRGQIPDTVDAHIREVAQDVYKLPEALLLALDIEELVAVSEEPALGTEPEGK